MTPQEFYDDIASHITAFGVYLQGVIAGADSPTFTYTIGLSPVVGYEVILVALPHQVAAIILNNLSRELKMGKRLEMDKPDSRWANMPCVFKEVTPKNAEEYGCQAFNFYNKDIKFVQMVVPDRNGHLPWDQEYDHIRMIGQSLLYKDS